MSLCPNAIANGCDLTSAAIIGKTNNRMKGVDSVGQIIL